MAVISSEVTLSGPKGKFGAYSATPGDGAKAGVVVIQEIFGVNRHIRAVTDRMAQAGYAALSPDLFHAQQAGVQLGYTEPDIQTGFGLMQGLDVPGAVAEIGACVEYLRKQTGGKVGVTGFCMGGLMTYLSAAAGAPDAAAAYYGGGIAANLDKANRIRCPIVFHFGEKDAHIPMSDVDKVRQAVANLADATVYTYAADHGFHCDERASFDSASAATAWARTLEFFAAKLA